MIPAGCPDAAGFPAPGSAGDAGAICLDAAGHAIHTYDPVRAAPEGMAAIRGEGTT